jgi:hypothetical protein
MGQVCKRFLGFIREAARANPDQALLFGVVFFYFLLPIPFIFGFLYYCMGILNIILDWPSLSGPAPLWQKFIIVAGLVAMFIISYRLDVREEQEYTYSEI